MDAYAPFRSRDYRFLLLGSFLSTFGLQTLSLAVSWDLYLQTRSAVVLGNVGLVQVAPFLLFALHAGHIADRYDRRQIMVAAQMPLLAASALLALTTTSVVLIYSCLFLIAVARSLQGPARQAILPPIVGEDLLHKAITWNSSAQEIATVSGPAVAGLLLASAGSRAAYILQFGCAILSLMCFLSIRYRGRPARKEAVPGQRPILDGVQFVRHNRLMVSALSLDLFAVLFGGAVALLPIYAVDVLHTGARGLGWLRAAPSIGAVSMAFILTHSPKIKHAGRAFLFCVAGFGVATVAFGLSHWLWLSFAALVLTGVFDNVSVVLRQSLVQTKTPDHLRGRVLAVNNIFISCSNQLGAVESGWTAAWFGAVGSVTGGGIATILIVLTFAAVFPQLRRWTQS